MKTFSIPVKRTSIMYAQVSAETQQAAIDQLEEDAAISGGYDEVLIADTEQYIEHEVQEDDVEEVDGYEGSPQFYQDAEQS